MDRTKWMKPAIAALSLSLLLGACAGSSGNNGSDGNGATDENAPNTAIESSLPVLVDSPFVLKGTDEGASDFEALNTGFESPFTNDSCQNITSPAIAENSDFTVFKYLVSNDTFVLYDGAAYAIGGAAGGDGDGVTSMALADLTGDGVYDLCYAYSRNSETRVGCFDPVEKTVNELPGNVSGQPAVLDTDGSRLLLCAAAVSNYESLTSMTLEAGEMLAAIVDRDGSPALEKVTAAQPADAAEPDNTVPAFSQDRVLADGEEPIAPNPVASE